MAAAPLVACQSSRLKELEKMFKRLKEKPRDEFNTNIVQMRTCSIQQIWEEARAAHFKIIKIEPAKVDNYIEAGTFARLQKLYEDLSDFLMGVLSELKKASKRLMRSGESATSDNHTSQSAGFVTAKLSRIPLPTLLSYLKSCLIGNAATILSGVTSSSRGAYDEVWKALNTRFQNPRFVVYKELRSLISLPSMAEESAQEPRQFTDEAQRIVRVLGNLRMPVEKWDVMIVFLLSERLSRVTKELWETELTAKDLNASLSHDEQDPLQRFPTFAQFSNFLEKRSRTLCMLARDKKLDSAARSKVVPSSKPTPGSKRTYHVAFRSIDDQLCPLCSSKHRINKCPQFKEKTPYARREEARKLKLCFNCLSNHKFNECKSQGRCLECQAKHYTMIHYSSLLLQNPKKSLPNPKYQKNERPSGSNGNNEHVNVHTARASSRQTASIILATAQVTLIGPNGHPTRARVILDQGSETSLVSDKIVQILNLPRQDTCISLTDLGVSDIETARFATQFLLQSLIDPTFELEIEALILQRLTSKLPDRQVRDIDYSLFARLNLADPQFHIPDTIDVILGVEVYSQLLRSGLQRFELPALIAQNTALGWIISVSTCSRRAASQSRSSMKAMHYVTNEELSETL